MSDLLLSFYGDDFTGSSAVMAVLASAGLRTAMFLTPPTRERLARFPGLRAVGVAGMSRTFTPAEMERELPPAFEALRALGAELLHYKICSTFDSSPQVGSIGRAIDLGQSAFRSPWVPLVVGAPAIQRYCLFGNLFARDGEETFRLDRHPTMSVHPVTPMDEADLRRHLGKQTARRVGLVDALALASADGGAARLAAARAAGAEVVLFDVVDEAHLAAIGRLMWDNRGSQPLFAVGSQGVEYALIAHWRAIGLVPAEVPPPAPAPVDQVLVLSGSCSRLTEQQIGHALEQGFWGVPADPARLLDPATAEGARRELVASIVTHLAAGRSVVVHSARGPRDPRIAQARAAGEAPTVGRALGLALGLVARDVLERHPLPRVVLSGGDTSGFSISALGVEALEIVHTATPSSPLCRAHAARAPIDDLELVLKGGQMGEPDLFSRVKAGQF